MSRKAAIITGSATGVGAASAKLLARNGWNVVINYSRSETEAVATAAACRTEGADALVVKGDVADDAACRHMVEAAVERFGRLDALVNAAGVTKFVQHEDLDGLSSDDFLRLYAVNVVGPYQMARAAAPHLKKSGRGDIVMVSSIGGIRAGGSSIAYCASKAALNNMTLALARALGPEIRVNCVCPGLIEGRWMRDAVGEERYAEIVSSWETTTPLRKTATPEDIAEHIYWFISGAPLVTGQVLVIDSGHHLGARAGHLKAPGSPAR